MLKISQKTEYALRAMIELALHPGTLTSAREISETQHIPLRFLEQQLGKCQARLGGLGAVLYLPTHFQGLVVIARSHIPVAHESRGLSQQALRQQA